MEMSGIVNKVCCTQAVEDRLNGRFHVIWLPKGEAQLRLPRLHIATGRSYPLRQEHHLYRHPAESIVTMICRRCLLRAANRRIAGSPQSRRAFTNSSRTNAEAVTAANTTTTNARPNDLPAATSTSAAQPFSSDLSPNPTEHEDDPQSPSNAAKEVKKRERTPSSVPAGTVLKGLNFMKNQQDPVAMEDHEYPDWLWEVLRSKQEAAGAGAEGEGDLFCRCYD